MISSRRLSPAVSTSALDRNSGIILLVALIAGLALAFAFAWELPQAAENEYPAVMFAAGLGISLLGVALRAYAMAVLGGFFTRTVTLQHGQHVVRHGPYRFVRHPCYAGSLLGLLGIGLALTNWASVSALMICALAGYGYRITVEERALADGLGEPYVAYMRRTKRLVPFVV